MTFQPPPPPPPPAGPPPPPPPGGGYGPPPPPGGGYGPPPGRGGGGFDAKAVNPLDWAIVGIAVLAVIFSYIKYYTYYGYSGGTGIVGFLAWVLGLVGAFAVLADHLVPNMRLPLPNRVVGFIAFALALVLSLLKMLARPGAFGFHVHIGFGLYAVTILYAAGAVLSLMRAQRTGTQLPGGMNRMPKIGK